MPKQLTQAFNKLGTRMYMNNMQSDNPHLATQEHKAA